MTIYMESQRFLCPACQRNWTGARGAACEPCYGAWMRERTLGEGAPPVPRDEPLPVEPWEEVRDG